MKNLLLFCILIFCIVNLQAQIDGPFSGSSFTNVTIAGSNKNWSNVNNAAGSDDLYSTFGNLGAGGYTDYLVATGFGFTLPPGVIIDGIVVEVERSDPNLRTSDYSIRIVKGGAIGASEHSSGSGYPSNDSYQSYGNSGDLWGETWTDADINATNFGIAIAARRSVGGGSTAGRIDDIRITVFYNFSTLPVKLAAFTAKKEKSSVVLNWTTTEESNMSKYEIQRASNGRDFTTIQTVSSRNSLTQINYTATDIMPKNGVNFYRLKMVEKDGTFAYSRILSVQLATGNLITIYPNPWKKGMSLKISNPNYEKLTVYFINSTGQHIGSSITSSTTLPTGILMNQSGIIYYRVINEKGNLMGTGSLLVN